ncbi:MAG: DUF3857 domain-containing protein [Candidatus Omnitrophota bacterium]
MPISGITRASFKKFFIGCCIFASLSSPLYGQADNIGEAGRLARESRQYYQRAAALYKELIAKGEDQNRLYFELGKLYYDCGEFENAVAALKKTARPEAAKFLAISFYRLGDFTDALEVFNKKGASDDEARYYWGMTCERLNLFDQALESYQKIRSADFASLALARVNAIEKRVNPASVEDTDSETHRIIASAPDEKDYPQAGAMFLYCDENIEITPDNTQVSCLHYVIKILNERGKEDFSESHISYDSTYEKVQLEYARTIKPDGSVVEVGSRHIRDVSRYLNFPLYSNARVYIISFPGVTEGAVIEYKVKILRNQLVNKNDFVTSYSLQADEPVVSAHFSVSIPKERPLKIKVINGPYNNFGADLAPEIEERKGLRIYSWRFKNIPQIIPESNMPPEVEINPAILISTFDSWQDVYEWWFSLANDKINADDSIKDKVAELVRDKASPEDKIKAIYNFCTQKIRYVAVEYGQAGYEPHRAADIFRNKYGDCKDQAVLLVSMLREAGFASWLALLSTKDSHNLNEDFPAILFNHCIAAMPLQDKLVFMDPTAETCSFGDLPADDQARLALLFKDDAYRIEATPLYPASYNFIRQLLELKVNDDESVSGERRVYSSGMYDQAQRYWLLYTPPELVEEALKEKVQDISIGAKLKGYSIKNLDNLGKPLELDYSFSGPEYFTLAGRLRIMPQLAIVDTSVVAREQRRYPLDFDILDSKKTVFEIEIPRDFKVKYMPQSVDRDSRWLRFKAGYQLKGNSIIFTQDAQLKKISVPVGEYADFKEFFEDLAKSVKQRIVLEKAH